MTRILRHLLWPLWGLQLATGAKSFVDNPLIGSPRLNAAGLHVARLKLAHRMGWWRRARLAGMIRPEDREDFDRDGFVIRRDFLPPDQFARLRAEVSAYRGPTREMLQGNAITRRIALDPAGLAAMPSARLLLDHPDWRGLIRYAGTFDCEPLNYVQTILSHRGDGPDDPQLVLHADSFQPSVKAWFFLDDVAEGEGPFTYVPGSHRLTPERIAWERSKSLVARDAERLTARGSFRIRHDELASLGLPQPVLCAVPANTLVIGDTFGFHARGPSLGPSKRVEIWAYARRNPYLPFIGLDLLGIPGIAERRIPAYWRFRDRFGRFVGQPWRNVGTKGAFED